MTLRMADGPVVNLPARMDAYAGYVDQGGIGITYPEVVAAFPNAFHLSISVHGAPAMCADVENGALSSWKGFDYGYANASSVGNLISRDGRPRKLWVAHYTNTPHICTSAVCWPPSPVAWEADGTQWTDHGGVYDESLLKVDFFSNPAPPPQPKGDVMNISQPPVDIVACATGGYWIAASDGGVFSFGCTFYGSAAGAHLAAPIVGMTATPTGKGYWLLGADGGVFSFGDAKYLGRVAVA